jgi:hypothetical protein
MHGIFPSFPRRDDSVVFAALEQAQNLAGKDIRRPISDPFSRCRVCGNLSQIVKAIHRKCDRCFKFNKRAELFVDTQTNRFPSSRCASTRSPFRING